MRHGLFTSRRELVRLSALLLPPKKPWKAPSLLKYSLEKEERSYTTDTMVHSYENAVETLNSLQSNAAVLEKLRLLKDRHSMYNRSMTEKYLTRVGIPVEMIDQNLPVIHVSGTKGKGSTCAFCESILQYSGLKTGFYSSPHLIEVRERIRINGKPLGKDLFSQYFWDVYTPLKRYKDDEEDMPAYFKFLTIMAFYVFMKEKVDVAIIEVGIGGLYDCTNVIRKPKVVGISSLGLDHLSLLGDTVEKIAVHKAGIMKPGVPTFTVPDQPGDTMRILKEKALEIQSPLYITPLLEEYEWAPYKMKLGLPGQVQFKNASLALQLSHAFLHPRIEQILPDTPVTKANPFRIHLPYALGLSRAFWPGRSQILHSENISFFIDGAHTPESIEACVEWFNHASHPNTLRVLVFNTTGDRDTNVLLSPLRECLFDVAIFCPNTIDTTVSASKDQINFMVTREQQIRRTESNRDAWIENNNATRAPQHNQTVLVASSINGALDSVRQLASTVQQLDVLVTGSLHLVGGFMSLLDPGLNSLLEEQCAPKRLNCQ